MPDNWLGDYPQKKKNNTNSNKTPLQILAESQQREQNRKDAEKIRKKENIKLSQTPAYQLKKLQQKYYTKQAKKKALEQLRKQISPISYETQLLMKQGIQAQKREGVIRSMASKAERMEQRFASINEVPLLRNMERARQDVLTVDNKWLEKQESDVVNSFPD